MIAADAVFGAGFGLVACAVVRAGRGAGCAAVLGGALDTVRAAGVGVTCGAGVGATAGAAATAGISFGFAASLLPSQFCRAWMAEGFSRLGLLVNRSSAVWAIAAAVMASSANAKNTRLIVPVPFDTPHHLARAPRRGNPRTWRMSLPENRYPPRPVPRTGFRRPMRQSFDRACLCAKE